MEPRNEYQNRIIIAWLKGNISNQTIEQAIRIPGSERT